MTPMKENYRKVDPELKKVFNKHFSKHRVYIEHVNGALKETFESLKSLRVKINDKAGHEAAVRWIRCCLVLYNITKPFDNWAPPPHGDESEEKQNTEEKNEDDDDFSAEEKRLALFDFVIGTN